MPIEFLKYLEIFEVINNIVDVPEILSSFELAPSSLALTRHRLLKTT